MILAAASELFAVGGFSQTSVRSVAAAAGVDSALVHHYFGTKDELFLAALALPLDLRVAIRPVVEGPLEGAGERMMRVFLGAWEQEPVRLRLLGLLRGSIEPQGARLVQDGFLRIVVRPVIDELGADQPDRRTALVAAQILGLIMIRYVLMVEPLASAPVEEVVALYAPILQRFLADPLPPG